MLDYLYGELEADERDAFERALPAFPEVQAELEQHRWTRQQMTRLPVVPLPSGALDAALAAAEKHASAVQVEAKPSWAERLRRFVMQPAFGVAFVAFIAVGVGVSVSKKGGVALESRGDEQQISAVTVEPARGQGVAKEEPVERSVKQAAEAEKVADREAAAAPAEVAALEAAPRPDIAPEPMKEPEAKPMEVMPSTPTVSAPAAEKALAKAPEPVQKPKAAAGGGNNFDSKKPDAYGLAAAKPTEKLVNRTENVPGMDGDGLMEAADEPAKPVVVADRPSNTTTAEGRSEEARTGTVGGLATGRMPPSPYSTGSGGDTDKSNGAAVAEAPARVADPAPADASPRNSADALAVERNRRVVSIDDEAQGNRTTTTGPMRVPEAKNEKAKDEAKESSKKEEREAGTRQGRAEPNQAPPPQTNAPANNTRAANEERLWTTFGQQMAIGAYADASLTLDELAKMGESARLKTAREAYKKQADAARKAEAERLKAAPTKPSEPAGEQPGKNR